MLERTGEWRFLGLDDALEYFGHESRDKDAHHDALTDARLAAKVYMELMKLPPLKVAELGFMFEEEEE